MKALWRILLGLLSTPGHFFRQLPKKPDLRHPLRFLLFGSLFFAGASLTGVYTRPLLMAGILFLNAFTMPFITAAAGFMVMTIFIGRRVAFAKIFSVYAFSAGVTLLVSWIPFFVWITEPWKWWLIGIGLVKGCDLSRLQAILIIGLSIGIVVFFFMSLNPVILSLKTAAG
ncbi:MAG: YIP1 family protein [Desulfobacteraceae bacterium]|jgi:hypothetical protein